MKSFILMLIIFTFLLPFYAEEEVVLVLKGGKKKKGTVVKETKEFIELKNKYGSSRKYLKSDIEKILKGSEVSIAGGDEEGASGNPAGDLIGSSYPAFSATRIDTVTDYENKLGLKLNKHQTSHFAIMSEWTDEINMEYLKLWEEMFKEFCIFWGVDHSQHFRGQQPLFLIFSTKDSLRRYIEKFVIVEQMDEATRDNYRNSPGLRTGSMYTSYKDEERMPSHEEFKKHTANVLGITMIEAHAGWRGDAIPIWLEQGYASYWEFKKFQMAGTSWGTQGSKTGRMIDEGWEHGEDWHDLLEETMENEELVQMSIILNIDLNAMTHRELAHAWSMVTFLIDEHKENFKKFVNGMIQQEGGKKSQLAMMKEAFNWGQKDFEKEWKSYLKRRK
jgi:hypothetical protein